MAVTRNATLTCRIEPRLKEALRLAAEQEHRSIANMVEVLILNYCDTHDINLQQFVTGESQKDAAL